jgi:hypothetical protein
LGVNPDRDHSAEVVDPADVGQGLLLDNDSEEILEGGDDVDDVDRHGIQVLDEVVLETNLAEA